MDTTLGLCLRYSLHSVDTTLILEYPIDTIPRDGEDDFLIATSSTLANACDFGCPSSPFTIAYVHAVEISSKECCLIPTCAATDLHDDILCILRICRDE